MAGDYPDTVQAGLRRVQQAVGADAGSIAAREDPNNGNSILSRTNPGLFGQFGSTNPTYQASSAAYYAKPNQAQSLRRDTAQQPAPQSAPAAAPQGFNPAVLNGFDQGAQATQESIGAGLGGPYGYGVGQNRLVSQGARTSFSSDLAGNGAEEDQATNPFNPGM